LRIVSDLHHHGGPIVHETVEPCMSHPSSATRELPVSLAQFDTAALQQIVDEVRVTATHGSVAKYIPALASVPPDQLGVAVATIDGRLFTAGDAHTGFSIQSISKLFALALALKTVGDDLWAHVDRLPSSNPFNSLIELELLGGRPRNPFINAGALAVSDVLCSRYVQMEMAIRQLMRNLSGNAGVDYDMHVAESEKACAHRNRAAAYLMKSFDNLANPVEDVINAYCNQCALSASCVDIARAALFLADGGTCPQTGNTILSPTQNRQVTALMMSCGTYESAGEVAFRVGLPVKTGVGGGVLAVVPGYGAICAWSPRLDSAGNSVAGLSVLEQFAVTTGASIFA
jgi:glutaminase